MRVTKRDGKLEEVSFDKVLRRIKILSNNLNNVDPTVVAQKVCSRIYDKVTTSELDELAARICTVMSTDIPEYGELASKIIISNNHKNTPDTFFGAIEKLNSIKVLDSKIYQFIKENKNKLNNAIVHERDYNFSWFSFKTLERAYLLKVNKKRVERIQYMFMRVSCGIHYPDIEEVLKSYEGMSNKYFTHATPTLFNSGTIRPQLLSCFLTKPADSIPGIYKWISDLAKISKEAGGIGGTVSCIRGKGAYIHGSNSYSSGIIPMLKVVNETMKYVNQGGRRAGSAAIYLEPHHPDIMEFLEIRLNHGNEDDRARDLFTAIWASDLFMKRVKNNEDWSLFDPKTCPNLDNVYGDEYEKLYLEYEKKGLAKKVLKAQEVWKGITRSQIETGTPYICFKDHVNRKSNQMNYGVIKASNLCVAPETLILTDKGYEIIKNLENKYVNVWNGKEFSKSLVKKTGENQKLINIKLSNGAELNCTEYHKFYISEKYHQKKPSIIEAKNLQKGMKLWKCDFPVIKKGIQNENEKFKYPYTHGLFCADGTYGNNNLKEKKCSYKAIKGTSYCKRHKNYSTENDTQHDKCQAISCKKMPKITLYGEKKKLVKYLKLRNNITKEDNNGNLNCYLNLNIPNKFEVPINCNLSIKIKWLEGYMDGDGSISINGKNDSLQCCSINKDFLEKIRLMCQTIGTDPKIIDGSKEGMKKLPNGKGDYNYYNCKKTYRLIFTSIDLYKLIQLGFSPKRLILRGNKPQRNARQFVKVLSIEDQNRISDTYCFGEPINNSGIFNGIYTSQCAEILEYHDENEYACCCLSSICLPRFLEEKNLKNDEVEIYTIDNCKFCVLAKKLLDNNKIHYSVIKVTKNNNPNKFKTFPQIVINGKLVGGYSNLRDYLRPTYNYKKLEEISGQMVRNLNKVIDVNLYPVPETKYSNFKHRPLGIGVQGLADVFCRMRYPFDSEEALELNNKIFETIYYGAMKASVKLAIKNGPYETFKGSPLSKGLFQFNLWGKEDSKRYDWEELRQSVMKNGVRNSLLVACMPTASTSQIMGNNETIEPITSNMYVRRTLSGEFIVSNKYMIADLRHLGLWDSKLKDRIIANNGSIQNISGIPESIKKLYRTSWELKQKALMDLSIGRGPFVCQTQSLNLFFEEPTTKILTSAMFYAWKNGLKTGVYYVRSRPKTQAQQFTIDPKLLNNKKLQEKQNENDESQFIQTDEKICYSCSG